MRSPTPINRSQSRQSSARSSFRPRIKPSAHAPEGGITLRCGQASTASTRLMSCRPVSKSMLIAVVVRPRASTRPGPNGTPRSETLVSFPIHPGDLVFVEVWNTSPPNGYAYFHNYSTGQVAEYQLTAPSGTSLVGNSVEWIVERPTVFGGLATLTNYIDSAWPNGIALNYQAATPTYQYQGQTPAAGTLNVITMVDNNGNSISSATIENSDFLWFRDFGSAAYSP